MLTRPAAASRERFPATSRKALGMRSAISSREQIGRAEVTFNALPLLPDGAGPSTYIRELLAELPRYVDGGLAAIVGRNAAGELPVGVTALARPPAAGFRRMLQGLMPAHGTGVFHGLDLDLPAASSCPRVTTVHDLAVYDVPWAFHRQKVVGEQLLVRHAVRCADVVIAVSDFTAERVAERFRREAVVIPEAPGRQFSPPPPQDVERVRRRYRLPERFVLHVGTIEPRKNLSLLAEVCRDLRVPLVAAGGASDRRVAVPPGVVTLGFVPGAELPSLYGAATIAAYLSFYEGFGLPPLEAMACGCAVVCSAIPAMRLVRGAGLVGAGDRAGLRRILGELLQDESQRCALAGEGRASVMKLSWAAAAEATARIYGSLGAHVRVAPLSEVTA